MWPSLRNCSHLLVIKTIITKSKNINNLRRKYHKHLNNNKDTNYYYSTLLTFDLKCVHSAKRLLSNFLKYNKMTNVPNNIFKGTSDRFSGIIVNSSEEYDDCHDFPNKLQRSLDYWLKQKCRCIWFNVQTKHSNWIPQLTEAGFEFHHARKGYAVLYRWLSLEEYINLPTYAHTMLGVGGLVTNDKDELLVISDRYALIPNSWKLPGGYAEPKENIIDAAIREVKEETGITTEFQTLISIRHSHRAIFNTSDLYFVVALKPIISKITPCMREIVKAEWMPFQEFLKHPNVHEINRSFLQAFLEYRKSNLCFNIVKTIHPILNIEYCLYSLKQNVSQKNENKHSGDVDTFKR